MATAAKQKEPDKLAIWNALGKTDPAHTKQFKRAGGFTGTAIKPIWIVHRLTELFGPCGVGWGVDEPQFQVINGENREVLVYCTVAGWYTEGGKRATVYGCGGDKIVTYIKANEQYKRPERWESDDEAFKKAFTDALGNAFKFVGVGADVHMGLFEDSKYLAAVTKEFAGPPANDSNGKVHKRDAPFPQGPCRNVTELKDKCREAWREIEGCGDIDEMMAAIQAHGDLLDQMRVALPHWWTGGDTKSGEHFEGLGDVIARKKAEFGEPVNDDWKRNPILGG